MEDGGVQEVTLCPSLVTHSHGLLLQQMHRGTTVSSKCWKMPQKPNLTHSETTYIQNLWCLTTTIHLYWSLCHLCSTYVEVVQERKRLTKENGWFGLNHRQWSLLQYLVSVLKSKRFVHYQTALIELLNMCRISIRFVHVYPLNRSMAFGRKSLMTDTLGQRQLSLPCSATCRWSESVHGRITLVLHSRCPGLPAGGHAAHRPGHWRGMLEERGPVSQQPQEGGSLPPKPPREVICALGSSSPQTPGWKAGEVIWFLVQHRYKHRNPRPGMKIIIN